MLRFWDAYSNGSIQTFDKNALSYSNGGDHKRVRCCLEGFLISVDCPLCSIPERESTIYSDDLIYLVKTKENKGHKTRLMVCTHRHTNKPTFEERTSAICLIYSYMSLVMGNQTWYIVSDTCATIPQHWHMISCDGLGTEDELISLHKSEKVRFPLLV